MTENRKLKVFLCHSRDDKSKVRGLYKDLVADGFDAWLDEEKLMPGQDWDLEIRKAVRGSDVVVVCLSNSSITKAGYVQKELRFALDVADEQPEGSIFIIPARLEDCEAPSRLSKWHWVNLFDEKGYQQLKNSLELRATVLGVLGRLPLKQQVVEKPAFNIAMNSPGQAEAIEKIEQIEPRYRLLRSPRFWMIAFVIAALSGTLIYNNFFRNNEGIVTESNDPTKYIAQAITTSTGTTQWTYGCLGNSDSAIVDLDCREIKIAVENRILPYNYIFLETNQPGGMDYDMWWEICTRRHCQPIFMEEKWETLLDKVRTGEYDAASEGITITEERRETLDFSISYLNIEQRLVVRKGEIRFSNINEFLENDELIAGALENSTNYDVAKLYIPQHRIKTYKEHSTVFYALATADIDAAIADQVEGVNTVSGIEPQWAITLEFIGNSLSSDQFGVVFPKESDLVQSVNKALQEMREQGILDELNARYFGPSFKVTYNDIDLGVH